MRNSRAFEERREAIVSAAVETFGKNDYKNASTETIAQAGISKGLFYFRTRRSCTCTSWSI